MHEEINLSLTFQDRSLANYNTHCSSGNMQLSCSLLSKATGQKEKKYIIQGGEKLTLKVWVPRTHEEEGGMHEMGPVTQAWMHSVHQALWQIQGAARAVGWVRR